MLIGLVGTIVLGIAVVGCLLFINKLTGKRLPRWIFPVGAAAGMLTFHIWNEYTWFDRTVSELPARVAIGQTYTTSNLLQPWTYVFPRINRFSAVDLATLRTNDKAPGYRLVEVYLATRFTPTVVSRQIYDCTMPRRMLVSASQEFGVDGLPTNPAWENLAADDRLRTEVCAAASG